MHLKSITLKGFKSFPDRTRLEFGPGVSVIVGPNGSGKSNITDAVLWALGEQSPLAVRGQSMQDVIFGGARGQQARRYAEVELVIEGSGDGPLPFPEVSILRRLDRTGEGEYRLNGARCRLVDVLEVLSDTGLGKEMHSVVSQGRVEAVVTSKPRDRRLLIEEAAGLGKHRKRRRRAQLKLGHTQDNLDRALDVEREARSRLRPLKRQAEAAESHARLARQTDEARWELARDALRAHRAELAQAEAEAAAARVAREEVERALAAVAARREAAEESLAGHSTQREALAGRRFAARSAEERIALRLEQSRSIADSLEQRAGALRARLEALEAEAPAGGRLAELEAELAELDRGRDAAGDVAALEQARQRAADDLGRRETQLAEAEATLRATDARCESTRAGRRDADTAAAAARRASASAAAELAKVEEFLRGSAGTPGGGRALADELGAEPGYELALAAALGGRLGAAVVGDRAAAHELLDAAGEQGGRAIVASPARAEAHDPPVAGAEPLAARLRGPGAAVELAESLLADAWVVETLDDVPDDFRGTAVTRAGRAWLGARRELRQAPAGGEERRLAERNRRDALREAAQAAAAAERESVALADRATAAVEEADTARDQAETAVHAARRERDGAAESARRAAWMIEQRRSAPEDGATGLRRAQLEAELQTERRRVERVAGLRDGAGRSAALAPVAARLVDSLTGLAAAVAQRGEALEGELDADRQAGEGLAAELRGCAHQEAELQSQLREKGEAVTVVEVSAQRLRDQAAESETEVAGLAESLGLEPEPASEALGDEQRGALEQQIERLARRREQLGPVNPLARDEYAEALAHVEQLETQRGDLETALRELASLIAETDRRIRESFEQTFEAAARNFEELVGQLFPGGRGRLRLVSEDGGPRPVLGGQSVENGGDEDETSGQEAEDSEEDLLGVEIEMTPAGKAMKRLSLLSGGEKSLTALAFLFAIFLARPCPFYVLDEVEAALDDLNIDRFLTLLRRYAERAQFIVVTHQKRTMEAADTLYGVSMGDDGISKVISRRLEQDAPSPIRAADAA